MPDLHSKLDHLNCEEAPALQHLRQEILMMIQRVDILRSEETSEEVDQILDIISAAIDRLISGDFPVGDQMLDDCRQRINWLATRFCEEPTGEFVVEEGERISGTFLRPPISSNPPTSA